MQVLLMRGNLLKVGDWLLSHFQETSLPFCFVFFYWCVTFDVTNTAENRLTLRTSNTHQLSPSWTLCRGRTLWERAGSPGSCSHSGPPALGSTSPRSRPRPPGGGAAPPQTPPSWSTRCRTRAALSGTLVRVKEKKTIRLDSREGNKEEFFQFLMSCRFSLTQHTAGLEIKFTAELSLFPHRPYGGILMSNCKIYICKLHTGEGDG